MKRIGLLGGTFNPPHIGHLIIANEVKHALNLDEVRLMPASIPPHKLNPSDASPEQRLEMVKLSINGADGLTAFSFEVDRGGVSYTYDTVAALRSEEPDIQFHFIIGGDMIDMLPSWHRIEDLVKIVTFVGVGRPGTIGTTSFPVQMVEIPQIDLSSTVIRHRIQKGGTVAFLLPAAVERYIREEGLYVD
ncbi:nicotinate-nucleotide adenylyltransferase [Sporosarcina sp. Te-1]|uniref:nicotinate-nucleotide adenylyltransferase n=1 Tax=Sporosarcina sp. Te-1 TaxID=2818390 RepID=UPI001A9D2B7F|nr:nicotinate-nucleotide adenylyltransferase [Sporosarcina sp. Te-1]QTD41636.1 nicotinate-nucleotide adenylyltransferase [Sporosarcina sp. Te-1]